MRVRRSAIVLTLGCMFLAPPATSADWIAATWSSTNPGQLIRVSESPLSWQYLGGSGVAQVQGMAKRSDGQFFIANLTDIYSIQTTGGAAQHVLHTTLTSIRAIAFSPDDELYAISDNALYTIDMDTGIANTIGLLALGGNQALEFSPDGVLYGWDSQRGLEIIDTTNAGTSPVNPAFDLPGVQVMQSLTFAPDGRLFACFILDIYQVDPETSELTYLPMSSFTRPVYAFGYFPEPATGSLLMIAVAFTSFHRRRR